MKFIHLLIVHLFLLAQHTSSQVLKANDSINDLSSSFANSVGYAANGITVAGRCCHTPAELLDLPSDLFVEATGNIYVVDAGNNPIQHWAPGASEGITMIGDIGIGPAPHQLNRPLKAFVYRTGYIYVADANIGGLIINHFSIHLFQCKFCNCKFVENTIKFYQ